jgi:outer membrane protein TolC
MMLIGMSVIPAQLANLKVDELSAENNIQTSAVLLQQAMGLTPSDSFNIKDINIPEKLTSIDYDVCLEEAYNSRPEILLNRAADKMAQAGLVTAHIRNAAGVI